MQEDSVGAGRVGMVVFLGVAFFGTWAGWITFYAFDLNEHTPRGWLLLYGSGYFCSLAGLMATAVVSGRSGIASLLRDTIRWRVPVRWWIFALFLPLVWGSATALLTGAVVGDIGSVHPTKAFALFTPPFLFWFVTGPFGEELGWRGFLLPQLLRRFKPLRAALLIGMLHVLWHVPLYFEEIFSVPDRMIHFIISLLCYSTLATLLYLRSRRSVLLTIAMHWSVNVTPYALVRIIPAVADRTEAFWIEPLVLGGVAVIAGLGLRREEADGAPNSRSIVPKLAPER